MQIKNKLLDNAYLVKLLKIYQEDQNLHYIYEYVPFSFRNYLQFCYLNAKPEQLGTKAILLVKKLSSELMMLISYLVWMKI